jgi:DNA-binding MarR family transcriptional regulator
MSAGNEGAKAGNAGRARFLLGALPMAHGALLGLELDTRPRSAARPALTGPQAACIEALRKGASSNSQIAVAAGLSHYKARSALLSLAGLRLAEKASGNHWRLTRRGKTCRFTTVPDRNGGAKLGRAVRRVLRALERPMSGRELGARLGVTPQRARQLIAGLRAAGRVRLGDPQLRPHIFARADDPTPLLSREELRVFSVVPERFATTAERIALAAKCRENIAERILGRLLALGLIAAEERAAVGKVYRLAEAGLAHPQYRRPAKRADAPALPVRSDRVCAVLALLAERGHAQITDVRDTLGVQHSSINALFQYLKRKSLVRKDGQDLRSPYVLTAEGREVLAEMQRRRAA